MSKVLAFDKDKYINNYQKVNNACFSIINSRELHHENSQKDKEKLEELIGTLYLDNKDAQIFILFNDDGEGNKKTPAAFAIFTSTEIPDTWVLELIYTHKDRANLGYASKLFKYAFKYLKQNLGAKEIVATVANNNIKSKTFHAKMIDTFCEGKCYKSDGENVDADEIDAFDGENEDDILNNENFDSDFLSINAGTTKFHFDLTKEFKNVKSQNSEM